MRCSGFFHLFYRVSLPLTFSSLARHSTYSMSKKPATVTGTIAAIWGILGFLLLLGYAVWRLTERSIEALQMPLNWTHWLVFITFLLFMAYSEGYKGFQKKFSPRFAARAKYLTQHTTFLRLLLAPLFCMSYFHAPKKRVTVTYILTVAIIVFILLFHLLPQPWRGLLDGGVVIGLIWGMMASILFCIKAFTSEQFSYDAEVLEIT